MEHHFIGSKFYFAISLFCSVSTVRNAETEVLSHDTTKPQMEGDLKIAN